MKGRREAKLSVCLPAFLVLSQKHSNLAWHPLHSTVIEQVASQLLDLISFA